MSGQWTQFRGNSPRLPGVTGIKISPFTFGCIPLYLWSLVRTLDPPRAKWQPRIELEMVQDMITQIPRPRNVVLFRSSFKLNILDLFSSSETLHSWLWSGLHSWFSAIFLESPGSEQWEPYITVLAIIYHFTTFYTNRSSKSPLPRCLSFKLDFTAEKRNWPETEKRRKPKLTFNTEWEMGSRRNEWRESAQVLGSK